MPTDPDAPAAEPQEAFVHLHTHTEYSLLDGAARIGELVAEAKKLGQPALAITDHGVLYGAVEFQAAAKAKGVAPIIGCEMYMAPRSRHDKEGRADRDPNHLVLLARDDTGYRNLVRLVSIAQLEGYYYKPRIDKELLAAHSEGLVCLSACIGGELPQAILRGDMDAAESVAREHLEIFGRDNYFLEVQDHGIPEEVEIRKGLLEIARRTDIPFVGTNDSHYIHAEDAEAHDILLCLQTQARRSDEKRFRFHGPNFYLAGGDEMRQRFSSFPEAVGNTVALARRCTFEMELGRTLLPRYEPIPEGLDADSYLRELCEHGLLERYGAEPTQEARERLAMELDVIRETGFAAYFLIVWDFVRAARCNDVKVGPGRGSAAGSLVAYVLRITNICPLRYGLIFERFLNRERVSMPDIDIDFDDRRRDRVIQYVQEKYGRERVAQIITFGTMAARAAIRDVGRVLDVPLADVDRLAKLVPQQIGISLEDASRSREMREVLEKEEWARQVVGIAKRLEGICRNASTHAAGVVIAPEPLMNYVPLQRSTTDRDSSLQVTQFDMDGVQKIGLLKMDFLGLTNLSVIEEALDNIELTTGKRIDIDEIPLDDATTYQLLGRADTLGVFQLEAAGGKKILIDMQPQSLEDMAAANALNRPGPIEGGVIDLYMKRKRGEEPIEYPAGLSDMLSPILATTFGTIVYQEQVMMIAQAVAGYTLGEADVLRAAMGKKDKAKMAQQQAKFLRGAAQRGVSEEIAVQLFDLIAFFAGYGFNRCVVGDTVVVDAVSGERTTIRALHERPRPFTVHGLGDDGRLRPRTVSAVLQNGRKPVFELRTASGRRIRATATHRFHTFDGWIQLGDLVVGDRVAVPRRIPIQTAESWPEHELVTLAGLLSEGSTCHPSSLYFFNNAQTLIDDFAAAVSKFPDTVARIHTRAGGRMEVCANTGRDHRFQPGQRPWNAVDGSSALVVEEGPSVRSGAFEWARSLGLLGVKATAKRVPEEVFRLRDQDIELFVGRLWAGDGYIGSSKSGDFTPFYATSSHQLARDVQLLLLRLGITSNLYEKSFRYRGSRRAGYTVNLVGDGAIERFVERIAAFCVGREDAVGSLVMHLDATERGETSTDVIPVGVRRWVDDRRRELGLTWRELEVGSGVSMRGFTNPGSRTRRGFRRSTIADIGRYLDSVRLLQAANSDVLWDRVTSITLHSVEETYDLTVDVDHNFVADGFIVHNSHATAYGLIGYQTAYLKANYPFEFMTALLNSKAGDFDRLKIAILDAHARGLTVRPPDIQRSGAGFSLGDPAEREILYGLGHIKNVGTKIVEGIVAAREEGGPFRSLLDICLRTGGRELNRRVLEALVQSGACDSLGDRAALLATVDRAIDRAAAIRRERESGQTSLFGLPAAEPVAPADEAATPPSLTHGDYDDVELPNVPPAGPDEKLRWERELLGMYLSDHPLRRVAAELRTRVDSSIGELGPHLDGLLVQVGGSVRDVRTVVPRRSTTGQRMAFMQIEDMTGSCEVVVFPRTFEECQSVLRPDAVIVVRGKVEAAQQRTVAGDALEEITGEQEAVKVIADSIYALDDPRLVTWRANQTLHLTVDHLHHDRMAALRETVDAHPGDTPIVIHVEHPTKVDEVTLSDHFAVDPSPALERTVEALLGVGSYRIEIRRARAPQREQRRGAPNGAVSSSPGLAAVRGR